MKTIVSIILVVVLLKFGWRLIKSTWKYAVSILIFIGLIAFIFSGGFANELLKGNKFLSKHGYETSVSGVEDFVSDMYDDRQEYLDGFKSIMKRYRSDAQKTIISSPVVLGLTDICDYQLDSLGNRISDTPLSTEEIRELVSQYNAKNGTSYKYKEW